MSLTLWEFFWTEADWIPGSASATVSLSYVGAGSGKHGNSNRLDRDFWEIRETYLRTHVEPILREVIPLELDIPTPAPESVADSPLERDQLFVLQFKRNSALRRANSATNEAELMATANRVIKLTLDIRTYISQYYAQAAIILLLDLF